MEPQQEAYDVVVIGGGPSGLAAGLWLGRYRRSVLVVDAGDPRNAETWAVHGYPGVDEVPPYELRRSMKEQALAAGAEFRAAMARTVEGAEDDFRVGLSDGHELRARRVLLCTGLKDILPEIPGFDELYGKSIWHCPDCDGPGVAGMRVGVIGWGRQIAGFCSYLLTWTDRITLLTHGHPPELPEKSRAVLDRLLIIPDGDMFRDRNSDRGQLLAEPGGVGVDGLAEGQFVADGENRCEHREFQI